MKTNGEGNTPYTPSVHLLYALRESLSLLKEEGFENVKARHSRLAEGLIYFFNNNNNENKYIYYLIIIIKGTRKAVEGWNLQLLCKDPRWYSDTLTVIETPEGIDSNLVVKNALARYNLSLGIGLFQVN